jgi:hypothetical protein
MNTRMNHNWIKRWIAGVLLSTMVFGLLAITIRVQAVSVDGLLAATPTPKKSWFNLFRSVLQKVRPKNITSLLTEAPTWGSPLDGKCAQIWSSYPVLAFYSYNPYTLSAQEKNFELMDEVGLLSCGWQPNEALKLTINWPNGRMFIQDLKANSQGNPVFNLYTYRARLDEPVGKYVFTIRGRTGTVSNSIYIGAPSKPNIYWLGDNRLVLMGFAKYEKVRLGIFTGTGPGKSFIGWSEPAVGPDGELWMSTDFSADTRVLLAESSTHPYLVVELVPSVPDKGIEWKEVCIMNQPTRLSPGQTTWVVSDRLPIYTEPDPSSRQVRNVWRNSRMVILEGPQCHGGRYWYRIRNNNGWEGWVQEANEFTYFLRP